VADDGLTLTWEGDDVLAALAGASFTGLRKAAEHLLQVSSQKAPHEEGTLERSGDISMDEDAGQVAVFFDTPYAVRQHEEMTWRHDDGREAKYLEGPMNTEKDTMLALIAKEAGEPLQ
jgi:hypothetical protein